MLFKRTTTLFAFLGLLFAKTAFKNKASMSTVSNNTQAIVIGGGLAGLSATNTILELGGNVLLLDKNSAFGGNSIKAASGINAASTQLQFDQNVSDSVKTFYHDSILSAKSKANPKLLHTLTSKSNSAVNWLSERFGLQMNELSLLAGHSQPRTHRGSHPDYPFKPLAFVLVDKTEKYSAAHPDRLQIKKNTRVTRLLTDSSNSSVIGVEYEDLNDKTHRSVYGPVVLATGGYAADFSDDSLLKLHHPEALKLSTTNGPYCTGDGHKMVSSIGGNTVDLDLIQIHPTGWVDPKDPSSMTKFLAAEALRGSGAVLLTDKGRRFCNELGYRDYVTAEMMKLNSPVQLVLPAKCVPEVANFVKFYSFKGLMREVDAEELSKILNCTTTDLENTFSTINKASRGEIKDLFGREQFGKQPFELSDKFFVGQVEPVLHYTMGGVQADSQARVLSKEGHPIEGLFAAGEIVGGLHGENRLGGSSLLACVVFGRLAGQGASSEMLTRLISAAKEASTSK
ncbi:fumerate reductase [Schizosaccharomyces cryophilus OY26]|uniref:Fumarate reductase n=1 Tax=Schizosaccharomyces cryophilus (strain OY26 / ATCC MYA-4695 / CBS 11777 / NBRC 106824 / NRRL Y48691) TaxID=653667 RepID=S9VYM3_SCHCR|nr:fumerate reductase [Schizosaccharomyces cryophilus OY26]EPY52768.1 fumerate reductase [Schizosaccharomyces cryophilus OY26]